MTWHIGNGFTVVVSVRLGFVGMGLLLCQCDLAGWEWVYCCVSETWLVGNGFTVVSVRLGWLGMGLLLCQ